MRKAVLYVLVALSASAMVLFSSCKKEVYPLVVIDEMYCDVTFPVCNNVQSCRSTMTYILPHSGLGVVNAYLIDKTNVTTFVPLPATSPRNPPYTIDYNCENGCIFFNIYFTTGEKITIDSPITCRIKVCVIHDGEVIKI